MKNNIISGLAKTRAKFMAALPIILFFVCLFYSIILLFGVSYVILVSVTTILFKVNFRKYFTVKQLLTLIGTQFLMAFLGVLATMNLPLCLILNLTVPFLLVFLQTNQFNQQGYYASAMCFTFLQLKHVGWQGLPKELGVLGYGLAILTAALFFCSMKNGKEDSFIPAQKGLILLANAIRKSIQPDARERSEAKQELFPILQGLYKEAYKTRGLTYVVSSKGKIQYMFALLFQRAVYFLSNPLQDGSLVSEDSHGLFLRLAEYMEAAGNEGFQTDSMHLEAFTRQGQKLLAETKSRDEAPFLFARNFLDLFLFILENIREMEEKEPAPSWKLPTYSQPLRKLFCRIKTDAFETRFALRLSVVLTAAFTYNTIFQANHGYWFALNAFLLLRPMYEDSASRVKSRFVGTVAGCLLLQFLIPLFPGSAWHYILATLMAVGLYMEIPGTWKQALFSTCFALTLTTMALPQHLALELRLLYVVAAILLVVVVNHFFFPTSMKSQFSYNLNQLFHIHHMYLRLLEQSLNSPLDYGTICDIQIFYHMVHDQILEYLTTTSDQDSAFIRELLWISWYMVSEAEQMLFLINNRKIHRLDVKQMDDYLMFTACILSDIQKKLNMKGENNPVTAQYTAYKRSMEGEPRLSKQMERYSKQVSRMYLCVSRHSAAPVSQGQRPFPLP